MFAIYDNPTVIIPIHVETSLPPPPPRRPPSFIPALWFREQREFDPIHNLCFHPLLVGANEPQSQLWSGASPTICNSNFLYPWHSRWPSWGSEQHQKLLQEDEEYKHRGECHYWWCCYVFASFFQSAGISQAGAYRFYIYITLTRSYTPRHAPRPLIPPLLQDTTFALTIALVDANSNLASIHDTCTVKLEVLNAAATLDLDGDNSWLLYDLVLTATSSTSPLEYGIAEFVGLSLNIPNTHVYLKAYCLENLLMMVTSTAHILVRETISVEQQLVDAQTISLPTGNGWTSTHNEAPNQYTVDAKILSASDSLFSTTCTSDTTNCHDNWEGDFHVFEMYDDPSCTPSTKLYDDYRKDNACRWASENTAREPWWRLEQWIPRNVYRRLHPHPLLN